MYYRNGAYENYFTSSWNINVSECNKLVYEANASSRLIPSVCLYYSILMGLSFFFCHINMRMLPKVFPVHVVQHNQLTWILHCRWNLITDITSASENYNKYLAWRAKGTAHSIRRTVQLLFAFLWGEKVSLKPGLKQLISG